MGVLAVGEIVAVDFPFTDGSRLKRRPAMVVASMTRGDAVVSYITSQPQPGSVLLPSRFVSTTGGGLPLDSFIRPEKLYTVGPSAVVRRLGEADRRVVHEVLARLRELFTPR
ncbi:type II toxin-antitoxin system PemK/MazF family toxin [Gryllotalpicola protaetiae]|uniref:Type II toxin-antitoxin system PemK/MazF family toxin n=1 Tax=Gryllotalpicola protaetiae TaxID=2419771 RepID=A0A387BN66_9MICO|nr:type II toxin-antitoxin system PemK/MazF family toxin [Gryllotalpicola protaetiae]